MQNIKKDKKKLQLTTQTVTKLRDALTDDQLQNVVGGMMPSSKLDGGLC
jgi:hypothetical protein